MSSGVPWDSKKPRVPEPSSPTVSYRSDEQPDDDMEDQGIISLILRNVDLTEVFSPARAVEACRRHGLVAGDSFDLRTSHYLTDLVTQRHVTKQIDTSGAVLVICSPPGTEFSSTSLTRSGQRSLRKRGNLQSKILISV